MIGSPWVAKFPQYHFTPRLGGREEGGVGAFKRTLAHVTGLSNVRDAIPFPRMPGNARY